MAWWVELEAGNESDVAREKEAPSPKAEARIGSGPLPSEVGAHPAAGALGDDDDGAWARPTAAVDGAGVAVDEPEVGADWDADWHIERDRLWRERLPREVGPNPRNWDADAGEVEEALLGRAHWAED